jgi:ABC-2 type transport system ATP-binding protein
MLAVETQSLTKRFGASAAVDRLSFEVEEGEVFGLLGPTTLAMLIVGFVVLDLIVFKPGTSLFRREEILVKAV